MPKVGQMGSTMFEGGSITKGLQLNQVKLPQTKITFTYKELQSVTKFTTCTRDTKIYNEYKIYKRCTKSHPRAKHAPSGTYSTWTAFTGI